MGETAAARLWRTTTEPAGGLRLAFAESVFLILGRFGLFELFAFELKRFGNEQKPPPRETSEAPEVNDLRLALMGSRLAVTSSDAQDFPRIGRLTRLDCVVACKRRRKRERVCS